jgi:hypothetical protein
MLPWMSVSRIEDFVEGLGAVKKQLVQLLTFY